mmetsp:Transcript_182861/g.579347  ORF Transcript_182861/g.579347 Transcript_182861/m.579347 type:complete len:137 (+) Transcript_182861:127-537(+)
MIMCKCADTSVLTGVLGAPPWSCNALTALCTGCRSNVDDFSTNAVEGFLEILYTGICTSAVDWGGILCMADKYQVDGVIKICLASMLNTLSLETVVPYFKALNKVSHLENVTLAKEQMMNKVELDKEWLRKLADAV